MSASLVGSEMCIRDRFRSDRRRRCAAPPAPALGKSGSEFLQIPSRREGCCLLYTSDAADDM
eukprot:14751064-Alexandrium_andersonii.AAC.1